MDYQTLKTFTIFKNLEHDGIHHVLNCLEANIKDYQKGEIIYNYLEKVDFAGVVLKGVALSSTFNANGDEHNIRFFEEGDLFGGSFACVPSAKIFLQVSAQSDCKILFLKLSNLMKDYAVNCPYASQVTVNLLSNIATSNIFQIQKTQIINQKKIRDKLKLFFLYSKIEDNQIVLPFNRQQLADYLGVERSALSREMSNMQRDGLIKYHKNIIHILDL